MAKKKTAEFYRLSWNVSGIKGHGDWVTAGPDLDQLFEIAATANEVVEEGSHWIERYDDGGSCAEAVQALFTKIAPHMQ